MLLLNLLRPVQVMLAAFQIIPNLLQFLWGDDTNSLVSTSHGRIIGSLMQSAGNRSFLAFRGIPYAKAPLGDLRFRDPVEVDPWSGVLDATREGPQCLQYDLAFSKVKGTEDCLVLNVYTHTVNPRIPKRPVLVSIPGGAWAFGSSNGETYLYGPKYFMDRDIVLVTLNYRLGALGFLSTEDEAAPGNYGLLDQTMALDWVRKNIQYFGGDPDSITLMGSSAGSASVEYQILSPRSKGRFHRAIMQSGSALCPWALSSNNGYYAQQLGSYVNCPTSSSRELIDCLRGQDPRSMVSFMAQSQINSIWPVVFGPRVDTERENPFLPRHPAEILQSGDYNAVPLISGLNENEGASFVAELLSLGGTRMKRFEGNLIRNLPLVFGQHLKPEGQPKSLKAYRRYFGRLRYPSGDLHALERMISDSSFFVCVSESIKYHSHYNDQVYSYFYTHRNSITFPLLFGVPRAIVDLGVSHSDDLLVLFNLPVIGLLLRSKADVRVTETLLDFWTSFAEHGYPSSPRISTEWLPTNEDAAHMNLRRNSYFVNATYPFAQRMPFWRDFYGF